MSADFASYAGRTVSTGTLRRDHLLAAFLPLLAELDPLTFGQVGDGESDEEIVACLTVDGSGDGIPSELDDAATELLVWTIDALNDVAGAHGHEFGTIEGDGAHFAFMPILDEDDLADAVDGYVAAMLWAGLHYADEDSEPVPLDSVANVDDVANRGEIEETLRDFLTANAADIAATGQRDFAQHGHDFLLTREGHGTGFWDRGYGDAGDRLTEACRPYGPADAYLGDDGQVYSS